MGLVFHLLFFSSRLGFKLERFYEGWKEGEMLQFLIGFHYYETKKLISISYLKVSVENYDNGLNILIFVCIQAKKGELRPPKLKTEDPNKSYVQRPVKRG